MLRIDKENYNLLCSLLIFLVCYILLALIAMRPIIAFDTFWHLQMGKDLMEGGLSPWVDHYSFSYPGKEISAIPVFFQILVYQFVSIFGEDEGFYFIKLFYITLLMSALFIYFRKIKANAFIIILLLPIIASAINLRLILRPEIFSNVLIVICLLLYLRAQKTFATKEMVFISLLLLFWVNYHAPIIGYIIIFGLFLDKFINKLVHKDESFSWRQWVFWGGVIFSIGFININAQYLVGQHFVLDTINVMSDDFGKYTQEYKQAYLLYSTDMMVHVSWALSIYVAIWSLIKKQYGFVFITILLTYFSWSLSRLVTVVMLVNMCVLALYFSQVTFSKHLVDIRSSVRKSLYVASFFIAALAFYHLANEAYASINENKNKQQILERRYPVQVADYLTNYQSGGNVLNVMQYGSYLINKLPPGFKVYFDGRTNILYPIDFVIHNDHLWRDAKIMNEAINRYDINYALRENTPERFAYLDSSEKLNLGFADDNYQLFTDRKINVFPLSSMLLVFPSCWNDDWVQGIQKEIALSEKLFEGKNYTLKFLLVFMNEYLSHEDKQFFFENLKPEEMHSDGVRRLALHLALKSTSTEIVSDLFTSVQLKTTYDILIYSHYLAKTEQYTDAENLLYYYFTNAKNNKKVITFDKIAIMYRVLSILENNTELQHFDSSYRGELGNKLKSVNFNVEGDLSFDYICK